jgi:hypothetical protein
MLEIVVSMASADIMAPLAAPKQKHSHGIILTIDI